MPLFKRKKKEPVQVQGSATSLNSVESAASKEMLGQPCMYDVPKVKDQPQLHRAVWKENLNKLKSATKPSNVNSLDKLSRTALHIACAKGLDDFIIHLVTVCNADPNIADKDGCTPVHRLIEGGHSRCLQTLLDGGNVKLGLSDKKGFTLLHYAAENGDVTAVRILVRCKNFPIDAINKDGHSALHLASYGGYQEVVQLLLEGGADSDIQDSEGRTSLMYACSLGHADVVKVLCDYSVDFELKDNIGEKALYYAVDGGHQECITVLEEHQRRLEREAENAASATPLTAEPSAVKSRNPLPTKASMLDGTPAVGFAQTGNNQSYSPTTEADPDTLNDSWAPSDLEEEMPKKPSLLAEGMNIVRTAEKESSKSVKIDSSATVPQAHTHKPHLDSVMSAPVTQISVSGRQSVKTQEKAEYESSVPKTITKSSIKTTKSAGGADGQTHPDWFAFQDYGTDESEDYSNLSDLLRDHPPSPLTHKIKQSSAKKLVDEATAQSSPEMVRNKEKTVRYAISHPSQPHPESLDKSQKPITPLSTPNIPAEMSHATTTRPSEEAPFANKSPDLSQHSTSSRVNRPPVEAKSSVYTQMSPPPAEHGYTQAPAVSTQTSIQSKENRAMKEGTPPLNQYESSSVSSHTPEQSTPRRHTYPAVHPYTIQPLPSQPDPSAYEYTMQPYKSVYTSGTPVGSQDRILQHVYTSGTVGDSQGNMHPSGTQLGHGMSEQPQGYPVNSLHSVHVQGSPVTPQRSMATQGSQVAPQRSMATQGSQVAPQRSMATQGSPVDPQRSMATQGSPVAPQRSMATQGSAVAPQRSMATQGTFSSHQANFQAHNALTDAREIVQTHGTPVHLQGQVETQGSLAGPQPSAHTQPTFVGPQESRMTSISRATYSVPQDESTIVPPLNATQQSPRRLSQGQPSAIPQNPVITSYQGSTSPRLRHYKPEGMDLLPNKDESAFAEVTKTSASHHEVHRTAELPIQSTMLSQAGGIQPPTFSSYLADVQKTKGMDTADSNIRKKLAFSTSANEYAPARDLQSSIFQPISTTSTFIGTSYTGPSYTGTYNLFSTTTPTSSAYRVHSNLNTTPLTSVTGSVLDRLAPSVGSPIYTGSAMNTFNKTSGQDLLTRSPVYTYKSPLVTTSQAGMAALNSTSLTKSPSLTNPENTSYTTKLDIDLGLHKSYSFSSSSGNEDSLTSPDLKSSMKKSPRHKSGSRSTSPSRTFFTNISIQNRGGKRSKSSKEEFNISFDSSGKVVTHSPRSTHTGSRTNSPSPSPRTTSISESHSHSRRKSSERSEHKPSCKLHGSSQGKTTKHVTLADTEEGNTSSSEKSHSSRRKRSGSYDRSLKDNRRKTSKDDGSKTSRRSRSSTCPVHGKVGASDKTKPAAAKELDSKQESPRPVRRAGYSEQQEPIAGHTTNREKSIESINTENITSVEHHQIYSDNAEEVDPPIAGITLYSVSTSQRRTSSTTSDKNSVKGRKSRESSREKQNINRTTSEADGNTSKRNEPRRDDADEIDGKNASEEKKRAKHRSRRSRSGDRRSRSKDRSGSASGDRRKQRSKERSGDKSKTGSRNRSRERSKGRSRERSESVETSEGEGACDTCYKKSPKHYNLKEHEARSQSGSRRNSTGGSQSGSRRNSTGGSHRERGHRRSGSGNQLLMVDTKFASVDGNGASSISESYLQSSYGRSSSVRTSISCDPALLVDARAQVDHVESDTSRTTLETLRIHEERSSVYSGHYEELCVTKTRLEQSALQAELDIRELKYSIRQRDETIKVNKVLQEQLRDHIKKLEERLGHEVEGREHAELKVREFELEERTRKIALQQMVEQEKNLREKLQAENDARQLQEGLYQEQIRVFQALQLESSKCQVYQQDLEKKLQESNRTIMELEANLSSATSELAVLKDEITTMKRRGSLTESAYEDELARLKEQLKALEDKNTEIEQNRVDMKTVFEQNLQELQTKAQFLNDGLITEKERRTAVEKENTSVKGERDELFAQHQKAISLAQEREQSLCQKLEEKIREGSVKDCELQNTRDLLSSQKARLDTTEAQVAVVEKALKTSEQESSQRAQEVASLNQTCQQLQDNVSRLKEYSSGLEKRCKEMEAKLESVSSRANTLEVEKERLLQQTDFSRLKLEEMDTLGKELQAKVEELTESNQQERAKMVDLQAKYELEQSQRLMVEESFTDAKKKLTASQSAMHKAETELKELQKKIIAMEHDLGALSNQDSLNRAELNAGQIRETEIKKELQHLVEIRKSLESAMSEKQQEIVSLQDQLNKTISIRDSASKEAEELRNLWEAEVKTKARLTQKVIEMETALAESKADAGNAIDTEKRRAKKACESQKALESRLETLQAYYSNKEAEMSRLKAELRVSKVHLKKLHQKEKLLSTLHGGFQEEKTGLLKEKEELRQMLDTTREQLKLEGEAKLQAQLTAAKAREDLDLSHSRLMQEHGEVTMKDKEMNRLVQANHQLKDEIASLKNMVADYNMCKKELEGYKKEVQEKARTELMQKLEEVNTHMDQQSQVQESLIKMHQEKEAEWRSKYNQAQDLVRQLQSQIKMDIESKNLENARLKSKLQREIQHAEKLTSQVQRSQEDVKQYKARLHLEKSRTEQLLKVSQRAASSVLTRANTDHTHISPEHGVHHTSINSSTTVPAQDGVQYQSLLCSVRAQLDQSISKHLDSAHVSVTTKEVSGSGSKPRPTELESIQRNYHV